MQKICIVVMRIHKRANEKKKETSATDTCRSLSQGHCGRHHLRISFQILHDRIEEMLVFCVKKKNNFSAPISMPMSRAHCDRSNSSQMLRCLFRFIFRDFRVNFSSRTHRFHFIMCVILRTLIWNMIIERAARYLMLISLILTIR